MVYKIRRKKHNEYPFFVMVRPFKFKKLTKNEKNAVAEISQLPDDLQFGALKRRFKGKVSNEKWEAIKNYWYEKY